MKKSYYLILFFFGMAASIVVAFLQPVPGYMDAEYYYSGGIRLAKGYGFTEMILWNYLDDPIGLPNISHTYWMPLASIISAIGMRLTGSVDFFSARIIFILLAGLIPPLTAFNAYSLTKNKRNAIIAGALALFPGYYMIYLTNTETFTLYMICGSLIIISPYDIDWRLTNRKTFYSQFFLLGLLVGIMHLTRADGILWLGGILIVKGWLILRFCKCVEYNQLKVRLIKGFGIITCILVGYLLVMFPWYLRNYNELGRFFPQGGARTIWLTNYDQTFSYPAEELNFQNWYAAGWKHHLKTRFYSLGMNLKTTLAVQGEIFLLPLIIFGLWRLKREKRVKIAIVMWGITLCIMTVIFPYAGARGGFLHAGAAFQPFFWAVAPHGLNVFVSAGVRWRKWRFQTASRFYSFALILMSAALTLGLFIQRVFGGSIQHPLWIESWDRCLMIENQLIELGAISTDIVLINNPPGYYAATERAALVIPDGNEHNVIDVAKRYGVDFLVLERDHAVGLRYLYKNPQNLNELSYIKSLDGVHIFRFEFNN